MLSNISWGDFFTYTTFAVVIYYITIGLLYFRQEAKDLLSAKRNGLGLNGTMKQASKIPVQAQPADIREDSHYLPGIDDLTKILNEVRYEVIPKAGSHPTKAKLAVVFQYYLETLNGNLTIPSRNNIIQLMIREAVEQCGISFGEEELQQLW